MKDNAKYNNYHKLFRLVMQQVNKKCYIKSVIAHIFVFLLIAKENVKT